MRNRGKVSLVAVSLAFGMTASADSLRLRSGQALQGTLLGADSHQLQFIGSDGVARTFDINDVDTVKFSVPPPPPPPPPTPPPKRGQTIMIPAGTLLTVRLIDNIDVSSTAVGQKFRASLDDPLMMGGDVIIPRGADAVLQVTRVVQGGNVKGSDEISLKLSSIVVNGRSYDVVSSYASQKTKGEGKPALRKTFGGAGLGAAIGAIAGGGKGAAIGALAGGATGAVVAASSKTHLKLPPETRLQFTLVSAVNVN
jgi:hypothetical protein